tara:strand:+ start:37 stop:525 length:489 start_codon:yes stop_codon:yes gene_type:complete
MKSALPEPNHDHTRCVDEAIAVAVQVCRLNKSRFTRLRRQVLELIWTSHQPVGAYSVLELMNAEGEGNVAPMTVYRAIDFLIENGLVHRIASRNAYVGCNHPEAPHTGHFLICRDCGQVAEIEEQAISNALVAGAERAGFDGVSSMVEIEGRCRDCREATNG